MSKIKRLSPLVNIKIDEPNFDFKNQKLEVMVNDEFVGYLSVKMTDKKAIERDFDFCYFESDGGFSNYIEKIIGSTNFEHYETPYEFADILSIHLNNIAGLFVKS